MGGWLLQRRARPRLDSLLLLLPPPPLRGCPCGRRRRHPPHPTTLTSPHPTPRPPPPLLQIRGLSGGQKVKLVLGAALWYQPHIVVLDEPTNYLDRESLGAMCESLKDFGGGECKLGGVLCVCVWGGGGEVLQAQGGPLAQHSRLLGGQAGRLGGWAASDPLAGRQAGRQDLWFMRDVGSVLCAVCPALPPSASGLHGPAPAAAVTACRLLLPAPAAGVVVVSHHNEFTSELCPEKWTVGGGRLVVTGQSAAALEAAKLEWKRQEEVRGARLTVLGCPSSLFLSQRPPPALAAHPTTPGRPFSRPIPALTSPPLTPLQTTDAFGNTIKIKAPKKDLSRKEKKAAAKAKAARKARGEEVSDDEEDF